MKFLVKAKLKYSCDSCDTSVTLVVKYKTEKQLFYKSRSFIIASTWGGDRDFLKICNKFLENLEENIKMKCIEIIKSDVNYKAHVDSIVALGQKINNTKELKFEIEIDND